MIMDFRSFLKALISSIKIRYQDLKTTHIWLYYQAKQFQNFAFFEILTLGAHFTRLPRPKSMLVGQPDLSSICQIQMWHWSWDTAKGCENLCFYSNCPLVLLLLSLSFSVSPTSLAWLGRERACCLFSLAKRRVKFVSSITNQSWGTGHRAPTGKEI